MSGGASQEFDAFTWGRDCKNKDLPEARQQAWNDWFRKRPFDRIRFGALWIKPKSGEGGPFTCNQEQDEILSYVEGEHYHNKPVKSVTLKARQIGSSTIWALISLCYMLSYPESSSHLIAHQTFASRRIKSMVRYAYLHLPKWARPKKGKDNDKELWLIDAEGHEAEYFTETAEGRDKISRSGTHQCNHFTEVPFWAQQNEAFDAAEAAIPKESPAVEKSIEGVEGTGYVRGDAFCTLFMGAFENRLPGWKAFFFPWFKHDEYRRKLPSGCTPEQFIAALDDDMKQLQKSYDLHAEQMHWYTYELEDQLQRGRTTIEGFKREFPSCIEEAFLGGGSNVFDSNQLNLAIIRAEGQRRTDYDYLPESTSLVAGGPLMFARCELQTDEDGGFKSPAFYDASSGHWTVWERPRLGHEYIVTVDTAEGRSKVEGSKNERDASVIDVARITYETGRAGMETAHTVQVAQYRSQATEPMELGKMAVAASILYRSTTYHDSKALLNCERNAAGVATIEGAKTGDANFMWSEVKGRHDTGFETMIGRNTTRGTNADGSKFVLVGLLKRMWQRGLMVINSIVTLREMNTYTNVGGSYRGSGDNHDDTVTTQFLFVDALKFRNGGECAPIPITTKADPEVVADTPKKLDRNEWLSRQPGEKKSRFKNLDCPC